MLIGIAHILPHKSLCRLARHLGWNPNISGLVVGWKTRHQAGNCVSVLSGLLVPAWFQPFPPGSGPEFQPGPDSGLVPAWFRPFRPETHPGTESTSNSSYFLSPSYCSGLVVGWKKITRLEKCSPTYPAWLPSKSALFEHGLKTTRPT